PRLYASPNHRYAVIIQRSDDLVSFLDSGYYIEDHGDHLHEYAADPTFLNYSLNGSRPTHYTTHEDISAIFFDGQEGIVSSVTLLSDEGIGSDETVAELNLTNNMHGVAKLIDDLLFVTYRDQIITDTTLPAAVDRYSFLDNTLTFEHRYEEACPKLHGSAATEDFITFGCSDGVLSINLNEPLYPATKLSNPDTLLEENRIGTLYSHHEVNEFVGVAGNQFYVINPNIPDDAYLELPLPDEVSRVAQGFDAHGEVFYILGNDGNLYLFSASDWSSIIPIKVTDTVEEDGVSPAITVSQSDDLLFVLNAGGQEIFVVDSETGSTLRTITLDFTASRLVWLGLSENHDHEHHE
ncbi:MAG TPA: hypothetical protein DCZ03_03225, partial [Gammaproteobacteria bacterium]|nr:hypothetical protein [Gammaproteobacteria bacterium]